MIKIAIGALIGLIIGFITAILIFKTKNRSVGTLQIDRTNEFSSGPYLFLELKKDPQDFMYEKRATFDILLENLGSRK